MEKFFTKETVITGVIGLLLGAIISTSAFLVCLKATARNNAAPLGERPGMRQGASDGEAQKGDQNDGQNTGTSPEKPGENQNGGGQNGDKPRTPPEEQQNGQAPQAQAESSVVE